MWKDALQWLRGMHSGSLREAFCYFVNRFQRVRCDVIIGSTDNSCTSDSCRESLSALLRIYGHG